MSLGDLLGAGLNCLPVAYLFLGAGLLGFAVAPRVAASLAYGLVLLTFAWELVGSQFDVPAWTLGLSPFHQVGLVPAQSFRAPAALAMLGGAAALTIAAALVFRRRDLVSA